MNKTADLFLAINLQSGIINVNMKVTETPIKISAHC